MRTFLPTAFLITVLLALASAAHAGPITSFTWSNCDDLGCEGTSLTLSVEDNLDGTFTVVQSINSFGFSEVRLGLNQVGFFAINKWTDVELVSAPDPGWADPPLSSPVASNKQCNAGGGGSKICTYGFTDITVDAIYSWEFLVTGGKLVAVSDWHWGGQFADEAGEASGLIISAPVPEPNAALAFGMGALIVGRALRRRPRR